MSIVIPIGLNVSVVVTKSRIIPTDVGCSILIVRFQFVRPKSSTSSFMLLLNTFETRSMTRAILDPEGYPVCRWSANNTTMDSGGSMGWSSYKRTVRNSPSRYYTLKIEKGHVDTGLGFNSRVQANYKRVCLLEVPPHDYKSNELLLGQDTLVTETSGRFLEGISSDYKPYEIIHPFLSSSIPKDNEIIHSPPSSSTPKDDELRHTRHYSKSSTVTFHNSVFV
uniref:Uncharacterized protein n=1 Tax=Timema shepardi TaxID=629360 RepID=A0A7R9AQN5_TIMSH|nr:unnamed protein product [Timema shepardi]